MCLLMTQQSSSSDTTTPQELTGSNVPGAETQRCRRCRCGSDVALQEAAASDAHAADGAAQQVQRREAALQEPDAPGAATLRSRSAAS
jgi:hypothetical protein